VADRHPLHAERWAGLTADEKADVLRRQPVAQEALLRSVMAATGIRLVDGSADATEEGP
jgi:hypothetical protein